MKIHGIDRLRSDPPNWTWLFVTSVLVVAFGVTMEWLFFATKPSFLTGFGWWEKISTLLVALLFPLAMLAPIHLLLLGLSKLTANKSLRCLCQALLLACLSLLLGATFFLMWDNFTYTMFHFGVKSLHAFGKFLYALGLVGLVAGAWRIVLALSLGLARSPRRRLFLQVVLATVLLAFLDLCWHLDFQGFTGAPVAAARSRRPLRTPNIILFSSDGVNADHMSLYGYQRDTTPAMKKFVAEHGALICQNAFANAGNTGGSVTSLLTGKRSFTTRVYYPPDILTGTDSFEHLPGILRRAGYQTADISVRHFADPYDLNMKNAFDCANGRRALNLDLQPWAGSSVVQSAAYLLGIWYERISSRLLYVAGLSPQVDNYDEVVGHVKPEQLGEPDQERWKQLQQFLDSATRPFFLHVHLMGTHGPKFFPSRRIFSAGQKQSKNWMIDFYDDAILDFDRRFQNLVSLLDQHGELANTLLVISSDHGEWYRTDVRIPLLFFFPGGSYQRTVRTNTQLLDVAPTILAYLGLEKPAWMAGRSLLNQDPDRFRLILGSSMDAIHEKDGLWFVDADKIRPPYYDLTRIDGLVCDRIYEVDFYQKRLRRARVVGHTDPCRPNQGPGEQEIFTAIGNLLEQNGYPAPPLSAWAGHESSP